jgi:lipopolysaccharide/colanic/teichoic acid biosynthesis glycosyltransferase
VGLDGKPFLLLKFRSLRPATQDESATRWSIALDDRLGPVGRILRKTSLDELPQLWNVLRGQMSIVGPRREGLHFVQQFTSEFPAYLARHRVPSGPTGMSQVHGLRGNTSIEDRSRLDNYSVEHWSLWADLKIMLRTAGAVLRGTGS